MAIAGKVAITLSTENGGAWSANVTYDRLVAVKHNNNLYISRKTVANVEPPNNEFWFLALEGFSGDDIEDIINGTTPVGNANLLSGLTAEQVGASGARNLIPYPYNETNVTKGGIEWVVNSNGTVMATGTSTANPNVFICRGRNEANGLILKAGTYTLNGCPEGGAITAYSIGVAKTKDGAFYEIGKDYGNGITFTLKEDTQIQIQINIANGVTVNNLTFRPMLEVGSVAHDFVPYYFGGAENAKNANTLDGLDSTAFLKLNGGGEVQKGADIPFAVKNTTSDAVSCFVGYTNGMGQSNHMGFSNGKPWIDGMGEMHHNGNKPTGTYTGNGRTEVRTVNVGGIGKVLLINGAGNKVFVDSDGACGIGSNGTVKNFTSGQVNYVNGVLSTATDDSMINSNGTVYSYTDL